VQHVRERDGEPKVGFESRETAQIWLDRRLSNYRGSSVVEMSAYECSVCSAWHVGKSRSVARRRVAALRSSWRAGRELAYLELGDRVVIGLEAESPSRLPSRRKAAIRMWVEAAVRRAPNTRP
jgi:hypothetical protein